VSVATSSSRRAGSARRSPAVYLRGVEAASYLTAACLAIRFLPFRQMVAIFRRALPCPEVTGAARSRAIEDVRRAVLAAAARLPNRPVCYPQAVAAQAMLRRRGVGTTLCCGVNTTHGHGLDAHMWLVAGDEGVVGLRLAARFPLLATYSNAAGAAAAPLAVQP
jgi:hypothetical protein